MQAQTAKRFMTTQMVALGLAASIVVAGGIALLSDIDLLPGGSESIAVEQTGPTFHRPVDRTGINSNNDAIAASEGEFHLPADRARLVGGTDEPTKSTNRPLDRGVGRR